MALFAPSNSLPRVKKGPWSEMEDKRLLDLVNYHGAESWMDISKEHGSRNAKQCRERYHQNLKSSINRGPITPEEGVAIERYHAEKGPKWAEIARALGGRSDNQVKNWYNGQKNRRTKMSAHTCHSMLHGAAVQPSLSAVRPVDAQLLHQRGHTNPYSRWSIDYHSKLSPTASQISEAPSLVSDASSTSSGVPPSPIAGYPVQPNLASSIFSSWNEHSTRPVLPPLCTVVPNTGRGNPSRMSRNIPPIAPPPSQLTLEMNRYLDGRLPNDLHLTRESQQQEEHSQFSGSLSRRENPSSLHIHSGSLAFSLPDHPSASLDHRSLDHFETPSSSGHTAFSYLEQRVSFDRSCPRRQSPSPPPLQAASSRRTRHPRRYVPYLSPRSLPATPDGSERTAKDRMKLVNILEH